MRKLLLSLFFALTAFGLYAQDCNVVLFSENGEQFYVILNGLRMNDTPQTNVKIDELKMPNYKLKVIFEDPNLGSMDKNLYLKPGYEVVYTIKKNRKGLYKLGYVSEAPLAQAPPAPREQVVIHYGAPQTTETVVVEETTTTTTTNSGGGTTGGNSGGTSDNVSIDMNVGGFGMDVSVTTTESGHDHGHDHDHGMHTTTNMDGFSSTTSTTTTTTTTSGGGGDVIFQDDPMPGYSGNTGCAYPMDQGEFESAKGSIRSKSFEDSKMSIAKQVTKANCMTAAQVRQVMECFDFESSKLEYAKFAFDFAYDQGNYYKVNDAFDFESSIEELDEYIQGR